MPRRLLLDGEDLPALMLRVKAEMGPGARIVKAERIRDGGFAGFFARERYELVVELPDPPTARERLRAARARSASGIDELLEAADAADEGVEGVEGGGAGTGGTVEAPEPEPFVSTSTDTFAQVLASMREMVGDVPGSPDVVGAEALPVEVLPPDPRPADAPPLMTWPVLPTPARPVVEPDVPEVMEVAEVIEVLDAPARVEPTAAPAGPAAHLDDGTTVARLLELGVPVRLLDGFAGLTQPVPLSQLVRRFDKPPAVRLGAGSLVVVAGPGEEALRTAGQMAQRARLDPHDVLLAGEIGSVAGHGRRLLTVSAAARVRSRLRDDGPTIVALGVGPTPSGTVQAATLLAALDPDQAWAVLDAGERAGQLRRWLRAVGERRAFDAVAAVNAYEAQAPGTVLDVGTPVGWVDGLPATAVVWAALLSERLAEDALDA